MPPSASAMTMSAIQPLLIEFPCDCSMSFVVLFSCLIFFWLIGRFVADMHGIFSDESVRHLKDEIRRRFWGNRKIFFCRILGQMLPEVDNRTVANPDYIDGKTHIPVPKAVHAGLFKYKQHAGSACKLLPVAQPKRLFRIRFRNFGGYRC